MVNEWLTNPAYFLGIPFGPPRSSDYEAKPLLFHNLVHCFCGLSKGASTPRSTETIPNSPPLWRCSEPRSKIRVGRWRLARTRGGRYSTLEPTFAAGPFNPQLTSLT